jgi:hypothetical protein
MISFHSGFLERLAFILLFAQLYDPIVVAFVPKQFNVLSSRNLNTVVSMNNQFRSNEDWAKEMKDLQIAQARERNQRAQEAQERNMQMARDKFNEEKQRSARIAELIAEKKALDQEMARQKFEELEAAKYAKADAVAKLIEEKRRQEEAKKWQQAEAKRNFQQAREAAAIKAMQEKRAMAEERAREEAEAKRALQQARAEAIAKAKKEQQAAAEARLREAMEANAAIRSAMAEAAIRNAQEKNNLIYERDIEAARARAFIQAKAAAVAGGYIDEFNNAMREGNQSNFDPNDISQNKVVKTKSQSPNQAQNTPPRNEQTAPATTSSTPPTTYTQSRYQVNQDQVAPTSYNQNVSQNIQSQAVPTTYNQNLSQNNLNTQTQQRFTYGNVGPAVETKVEEVKIPSIEELNSLLDIAISAAIEAGQIIASNMGGTEVSKLKANPRDLLTEIDPKCEKVIKEKILSRFPNHDFLGEEDVDPGKDASALALEDKLARNGRSDYLWIVDPIDGKNMITFPMIF